MYQIKKNIHFSSFLFFFPALILLLIFIIVPVILAFSLAFTNYQLTGISLDDIKFIGMDNFIRALSDQRFYTALQRTLVFLIFSSFIGQQLFGFFLALLMKQRNIQVRRFTGSCVLAGWVCPEVVAGMCFIAFYTHGGMLDTIVQAFGIKPLPWLIAIPMTSVIIANIWRGTAFSMLQFQAALDKIPDSVKEAAVLDGATPFIRLTHIIIPMLKKDILTNMILNTLSTLGVFGMIFMLTRGGPGDKTQVFSLFLYEQAFIRYQLGYGTAISIIILIVGMTLNTLYLRLIANEKI
ncbi:MAG: carbohydrate ABC transporter permease [Brevinema sp.]